MKNIFRAYDIRGIFNKEITPGVASRIGAAFGTYAGGKGKFLVGRDPRTSSVILSDAFISGLAATGCDVHDTGLVPIPTVNFKIWKGGYNGGAYITASHNPPEYNGIRFRNSDGSGYTEQNEKVRDIFFGGDFRLADWDKVGEITKLNPEETIKEYSDFVLKKFKLEGPLKVVLDPGNGAACLVAPQVFKKFGARVSTINEMPDGTFPGRPSEPNDETLAELKKSVVSKGADFGVGYDGDSDRGVFVDDKGRVVQAEKIGIILSRDILKKKKGSIVANIDCSMIVEREIEKAGGKVKRVRVGDVFVAEAIKKHKALFAMETSAHFFMPELYIFDDPIAVGLKLGEILSKNKAKLSEMADAIPSYPRATKKFPCPDETKFDIVDRVVKSFKKKNYKTDLTDGVKVTFKDGWALLRPSNTTPLIRASAEAEKKARLDEILIMVEKEVRKAMQKNT